MECDNVKIDFTKIFFSKPPLECKIVYPISFEDISNLKELDSFGHKKKLKKLINKLFGPFPSALKYMNLPNSNISPKEYYLSFGNTLESFFNDFENDDGTFQKIVCELLNESFEVFNFNEIIISFHKEKNIKSFFNVAISENVKIKSLHFSFEEEENDGDDDHNNDKIKIDSKFILLCDYIKKSPFLEKLYLKSRSLTNDHIKMLSNYLENNKNIKILDISCNNKINNGSVEFLDNILNKTNIKIIHVYGTKINNENFLKKLFENFFEGIKNGFYDENIIKLSNFELNDNGILYMVENINKIEVNLNNIEFIDLRDNYITSKGANILFNQLKIDLNIIKLSCIYLSGNKLDDDSMDTLSNLIKKKQSIKEIDLSFNKITDKGVEILFNSLMGNIFIEHVDLSGNVDISDNSFEILCEFSKKSNVRYISVSYTKISNSSIHLLESILSKPLDGREIPLITNFDVKSASKTIKE